MIYLSWIVGGLATFLTIWQGFEVRTQRICLRKSDELFKNLQSEVGCTARK